MMMIQTIVYGYVYLFIYFFFLLVFKSFGWPFCSALPPEVLELCVVFGCLCILVVLSYVCSFHLQMRGSPVGYVQGFLLA